GGFIPPGSRSAIIQCFQPVHGGTYTIVFSDNFSTTGAYTAQVYLNATVDFGAHSTRQTAQFLISSSVSVGTSQAFFTRSAAVGSVGSSLVLNAADTGAWNNQGAHTAGNENYIAGQAPPNQFRDHFVFNLSGVTQTIATAQLSAANPSNGYT